MNAHLPAVLHRKIAGIPVWGIGLGGGVAVGLYLRMRSPGVGGAQAATTPASGPGVDAYGDPLPADAGTFPQTIPGYSGGSGGSSGGGVDTGTQDAIAAGFASLGDLFANTPPPLDYSQQIGDLTASVGSLRDQINTTHTEDPAKTAAAKTASTHAGAKAANVHAQAARGGHAVKPEGKKTAAKKPATHANPAPPHPKAAATHAAAKPANVAHTPPPKPKPKPAPKGRQQK